MNFSFHENLLAYVHESLRTVMSIKGKEKFAEIVRRARGNRTKVEFARLIGVSHTTVGSWEAGERLPDRENLVSVAHILGYSLEQLQKVIDGKTVENQVVSTDSILRQIETMPTKQLAQINRAVADRFVAIAESAGGR